MHSMRTFLLILMTMTFFGSCRMRSENSQALSAGSSGSMKLFATCTSESPTSRYRNVIVQEDTANSKGLVTLDRGESGSENQVVWSASLLVENRDSTDVRKTFTGNNFVFSIDLNKKENETFLARLKETSGASDVAYACAI